MTDYKAIYAEARDAVPHVRNSNSQRLRMQVGIAAVVAAAQQEVLGEAAGLIKMQRGFHTGSAEWWSGSDAAEKLVVAHAQAIRKGTQ